MILTQLLGQAWAGSQVPDAFTEALSKGPLYAALAALLGGVLVSLTPCVYPMIAVTVSVFGARQARGRWEGALLSLSFVLGIIAMFVPLGVAAGLTGSLFGAVLQSRWVILGMALLFLALAASLFGAFELTLPPSLNNRLAMLGGMGYRGAFLLGLACGLIASPCTGPVLTGILTYIAKTRSASLGALAMGAFALGLGLPFFAVGTFAVQLPKSGRWMVHVKSMLGIVLVVLALHFLNNVLPGLSRFARPSWEWLSAMGVLILFGLALGAVHRDFAEPGVGVKLSKGVGIVITSVAAFGLVAALTKPPGLVDWEHHLVAAKSRAQLESRPLLVDFTATWCGACKELDRVTFAEPDVKNELDRFVAVKVDATDDEDPQVKAALKEFGVVGLPTVIVLNSLGQEVHRYHAFVGPEPFLQTLRRVD